MLSGHSKYKLGTDKRGKPALYVMLVANCEGHDADFQLFHKSC